MCLVLGGDPLGSACSPAELVRLALHGADPLAALPDILDLVHPELRDPYAVVLAPGRHPEQATE